MSLVEAFGEPDLDMCLCSYSGGCNEVSATAGIMHLESLKLHGPVLEYGIQTCGRWQGKGDIMMQERGQRMFIIQERWLLSFYLQEW